MALHTISGNLTGKIKALCFGGAFLIWMTGNNNENVVV